MPVFITTLHVYIHTSRSEVSLLYSAAGKEIFYAAINKMIKKETAAGKSTDLNADKARNARLRRLDIQRLRSIFRTSTPEITPPAGDLHSSAPSKAEDIPFTSGEGEGSSWGRGLVYGHVAMMGWRRVMEDALTVAPPGWLEGEYYYFAVYDGHGGVAVAETCREKMHMCLEKHIEKAKVVPKEEDFDWERLMTECFSTMDEEIEEDKGDRAAAVGEETMMGSTAVVVLVGKEELVVANCGDSRAVLCRSGVPVALSRDHKSQPDREDEKERIEAAGGKVMNWNGWRVEGVLATSRSLGDHYLRPYVTSKPEVTVIRRSESDEFVIIATDGLFDVVCNEIACKVVKKCLRGKRRRRASNKSGASEAAATLAQVAIVKGSRDNISIIVVEL